jgi:acetylornithine deacetylase/succinyl-diaminopimelate desuccinylase-like protein
MTEHRTRAIEYAHQNSEVFLNNLKEIVAIPSVSTSMEHKADMQRAAEWNAAKLNDLGMNNVQVMQTGGHPVVYADWLNAPGAPTILVYGHYDVQPSEPNELWNSPPFVPTLNGACLVGRGASDMKGQVVAVFSAIEAIIRTQGSFPVNLKFLIEGEEEIGSPSLSGFIEQHKDLLAADVALNPDAGMIGADVPTLVYALRGLAYFELRVYGPSGDLHSGLYGGVVHNPAQALCELIAGMHDSQGRVTLPGYYDRVHPLPEEERAELARLPMDEAYYRQQTGVPQVWGEAGYTPVERVGARPTLEVNGLYAGFIGAGSKTVLPSYAMAKISMRLVPDQDPAEVHQQLRRYLEEHAPATIRWELTAMQGGPASLSDPHQPAAEALANALEQVWGKRPVYKREGGSIPVVSDMQKLLHIDSVLTGFGLPDDNLHAPNEKLHLPTWYKGIDALVHFFYNFSA